MRIGVNKFIDGIVLTQEKVWFELVNWNWYEGLQISSNAIVNLRKTVSHRRRYTVTR
jgi:hypothetical protein